MVCSDPKLSYLLFYDTFEHVEHVEESQIDMISFNSPVILHEIRVVPMGVAGHPQAPMKGETKPDNFTLDFFAKVAKNQNACVFEPVGHLDYNNGSIQLMVNKLGLIQNLVLYGTFSACTLAVYGTPYEDEVNNFLNPGPPSPMSDHNNHSPMDDDSSLDSMSDKEDASKEEEIDDKSDVDIDDIELDAKIEEARKTLQERNKVETLYECLSPENSPTHGGSQKNVSTKEDYEELSDEELPAAAEEPSAPDTQPDLDSQGDDEEEEVPSWMFVSIGYDPYSFRPAPLTFLNTPTATFYQKNDKRMKQKNFDKPWHIKAPPSVTTLTNLVKGHGSNPEVTPKWVLALEQCHGLVSNFLHYIQKDELRNMVVLLGKWVLSALSMSALSGLPPGLNVRCLKAGLMLMEALCNCSPDIVDILLKENVIHKLLKTLTEPTLGTPTRLLALQATAASFISDKAIKEFVKMSLVGVGKTGYQVLTDILLHSPTERVSYAATVLINRVHLYELLLTIKTSAQKCVKLSQESKKLDESSRTLTSEYNTIAISLATLVEQYLEKTHGLALINSKTFPSSNPSPETANHGFIYILTLMEEMLTIESIAMVISIPVIRRSVNLTQDLNAFIIKMLSSFTGSVFLASRVDACGFIIRALLDNTDPDMEVTELPSLGQINHSDIKLNSHSLGLLLTIHLNSIQLLDKVLNVAVKEPFEDDVGMVAALTFISDLLHVPAGRAAFFTLLSSGNNMTALLTFLTVQNDKNLEKQRKRSLAYRHAVHTLQLFVKSKEGMNGIIRNLQAFTNHFSKSEKDESFINVSEWVHPFVNLKMSCSRVESVLEYIKTYSENMKDETVLPRLTTALRIVEHLVLQHVPISPQVALLLTSSDAMNIIINLFESCYKMIQKPWMQGILCGDIVISVVSMLQPALDISYQYISHLMSNNHPYANMGIIKPMLQLHTLLFSLPPPQAVSNTMCTLQHTLANILLTFTSGSSQNDDSNWTSLVKEIISYSTSTPQVFISSLMMFCELLPETLPIVSQIDIGESEQKVLLYYRQTWAAHLQPFWEEFKVHMQSLLPSSSKNVYQVVRRLLGQICDLSNQYADDIILLLFDELTEENDSVLQYLCYLSYVGSSKASIMDYLIANKDKFDLLLQKTACDQEVVAQHALLCLYGLCDPFVSMLDYNPSVSGISQALANSVPPTDMLQSISQALLTNLNQGTYTTVAVRLRTIWNFADNRLGQEAIKLSTHGGEYKAVLGRLCEDSSVTQEHDQCSSLLLDLLHRLTERREGETQLHEIARNLLGPEGIEMLQQLSMILGPGSDLTGDITELLNKFKEEVTVEPNNEVLVIPVRGSGKSQWEHRLVSVSQPRSRFWQPTNTDEIETDHVRVDLEELSKTVLSDYDLKDDLETQLKLGGVTYMKERKEQRVSGLGEGEHCNARYLDKRGTIYQRARAQKGGTPSLLRLAAGNDLVRDVFRSRKQNTSRPPSMHVDDFIAMEKNKTGPTLPPTNQIPMLQERYSNADLQHPSPLTLWNQNRQTLGGHYHHQQAQHMYNYRSVPDRGVQQGNWYQGANQSHGGGRPIDGGRAGNMFYSRDRFSGRGRPTGRPADNVTTTYHTRQRPFR